MIAVLGGNGVYARHLIPRLVGAGHAVRALVRRPDAAGVARACGAEVRIADLFDPAALEAGLAGCELAVHAATALTGGDFAMNDHLRRSGTPIWLDACRRAGVSRLVQQSIAMVNAAGGEAWADEDTPAAPGDYEGAARAIEATLAMEAMVRDSGLDGVILRGGLFYGPGTGLDDGWFTRAQAGKLRLPGDGTAYVSLVHVADMADATLAAIQRWPAERTLVVCDDRPATWGEIFHHVAAVTGAAPPPPGARLGFPSFRLRNHRARTALAWAPRYPDFRSGLAR